MASDYFWFRAKLVLVERLLQLAQIPPAGRLLSAGAGTGEETAVLGRYGDVVTLDAEPRALELIDRENHPVRGDVQQLPFVSHSFDAACLFDVMEHLPDDWAAVKELGRVLRPGGKLLLTVPAFPSLFSGHDRALGHYRRYYRSGLRQLLQDWEEITIGWWSAATFPLFVASRLMNRKRDTLNYPQPPLWMNRLLYHWLALEAGAAGTRFSPLFGSSLYAVFRKR